MNPSGRQIADKWVKTRALIRDERVSKYIPETHIFSPQHLKEMLLRYNMIVLKPVVGTGGHGLMRMAKMGEGYSCHYKDRVQHFPEFEVLASFAKRQVRNRKYIIQQGIHLAKIENRPLDYRVKIVKRDEKWVITAMVGRLARKGFFVTNLCKGGTQFTFDQAIRQSLPGVNSRVKKEELRKLTRLCTRMMEGKFPGINQLGFDYGLDLEGNIWMFEVNTKPWGLPSVES
jgi:glutathione synthase/RimK-type ligase-like ATP-grasp enzyme